MRSDDELNAWRKRVRIAQRVVDTLSSGRQVWMKDSARGAVFYESPKDRGPGVVVYDLDFKTGTFALRYRIVGLTLPTKETPCNT